MPGSSHAPVVVKVGGAVLGHLDRFWPQVKALHTEVPVVIIHGGGKAASTLAGKLGHEPRIVQGRRITTSLDLRIVEWTMRGAISVDLVSQAFVHGLRGVGLSGADGGLLRVTRRKPWIIDGQEVDFGWVGEIADVNTSILVTLLSADYLPVIAPVGIDTQGQRYNVNADTVAGAVAVALQADTLTFVTETGGIRRHAQDPQTLMRSLDALQMRDGCEAGWISGGMLVKCQVAAAARRDGVQQVYITGPDDLIERARATRIAG